MFRFIANNKGLFVLAVTVLASFLWITSQVRRPGGPSLLDRGVSAVSYPFVKAAGAVGGGVRGVWEGYIYLVGTADENDRLDTENARLSFENTKLREALAKSARLHELWALKEETQYPVVPASVVGRDASSWFNSLWVDRGVSSGVRKDMPAAVHTGLVGRVSVLYGGSARVMLITDPRSSVSCLSQRSRDTGILAGDGTGLCVLKYVDKHADIKPGDLVVSSGLDGVFPEGMPVGLVVKAVRDAPGYFQDVRVRPVADLMRLEDLLIIRYEPPALR
jgi:rod shape-determining protein MreC